MEYLHGGDVYRNQVQFDFSVNINPLGMPEGCAEAAKRGVELSMRYPDWKGEALVQALAEAEKTELDGIVLGNGAAELLYALCFFLRPGRVLIPAPSFQEYEAAARAAGGECVFFPLNEERAFAIGEDFADAVTPGTDLVFLCNPNNPTGGTVSEAVLRRLAARCFRAGACLCVDECFLPFAEEEACLTAKPLLGEFPNLVILRAFTKIFAMPGLRLGYAMTADRRLARGIRSCMQPWNTSVPAQLAGWQALQAKGFAERTKAFVAAERLWLEAELSRLAQEGRLDKVYPSRANFILFQGRWKLKEELLREGILIRDCGNFRGLSEGYFRAAVRTREENEALLAGLRQCTGG